MRDWPYRWPWTSECEIGRSIMPERFNSTSTPHFAQSVSSDNPEQGVVTQGERESAGQTP